MRRMTATACDDREIREQRDRLQNAGMWAVARLHPQARRKVVACYDKTVATALWLLLALSWKKAVNFMINYS